MIPSQTQVTDLYQKSFEAHKRAMLAAGGRAIDVEKAAQKLAIKDVALHYFQGSTAADKAAIWNMIYIAHVARKSGVSISQELFNKVFSANQSWNKSSGHAFEELVKELGNQALVDTGISIVLQRDLHELVQNNEIVNDPEDLGWLRAQLSDSTFDLYAVSRGKVFGCIQLKTSIRDRVTRDREPSTLAMGHFFWSIAIVLNGDFFRLPKFQAMVNGGTVAYHNNGWHNVYVFSVPDQSVVRGRLILLEDGLSQLRNDAIAAADDWFGSRRQWMNQSWEPRRE